MRGRFLLKHSNTIVVLLGNHDVWNVVQSAINPKDPSRLILKAVPPNTTFTWARFCCMYSTATYVIFVHTVETANSLPSALAIGDEVIK